MVLNVAKPFGPTAVAVCGDVFNVPVDVMLTKPVKSKSRLPFESTEPTVGAGVMFEFCTNVEGCCTNSNAVPETTNLLRFPVVDDAIAENVVNKEDVDKAAAATFALTMLKMSCSLSTIGFNLNDTRNDKVRSKPSPQLYDKPENAMVDAPTLMVDVFETKVLPSNKAALRMLFTPVMLLNVIDDKMVGNKSVSADPPPSRMMNLQTATLPEVFDKVGSWYNV